MGRRMMVLMVLALAAPVRAQEEYRDGRIRYVEPGVMLQRAQEPGTEEALPNMPFLPGDRVWTDGSGRAEFQFADGSITRLDSRSKLDYLEHQEGRRGERIVLRIWSGGLYVRTRGNRDFPSFEIETPGGVVETEDRGVYRVDVESGETRLTVYDGVATLDSGGRRVSVDAGERTYASRGEEPESPRRFDREDIDDFARWDEDREDRQAWAGTSQRYLPEEVDPYAGELDSYGSWYYEAELGHVWRPYVGAGWRPYSDGRWIWTIYGWTWIPYEPWGWAAYHYGRWGYSPALGWYWIPGSAWGPAWVSWSFYGDYVGWCPLGYRDRPVILHEAGRRERATKGYAVPRGAAPADTATADETTASDAWTFVRKGDLAARDLARHRVAVRAEDLRNIRVIDSPRARLTRELKVADAAPAPRNIMTKPTLGDNVPELRSDPATTIPLPVPRRKAREEDRQDSIRFERQDDRHPTDIRSPRSSTPSETRPRPEREIRSAPHRDSYEPARTAPPAPIDHPTDSRTPRTADPPREREPQRMRDSSDRAPARPREPEREVLRPFFQPLSEPRSAAPRNEPRSTTPRSEPRQVAPPRHEPPRHAAPPPQPIAHERPKKEKEK